MACSTLIPQGTLRDLFTSIFPDCTTLQGSSTFMKKLTAISFSFMTYLRGVFPHEAYSDLNFGDIPLKVLNKNCGIGSVENFVRYIKNCYDAIDKRYLQQISIGIGMDPNDKNNVVEAYTLKFKYTEENEYSITINNQTTMSSKLCEIEATAKATYIMMENIMRCSQSLEDLPPHTHIFIRLLYYDDVTPTEYEPIGFMPCEKEKFSFTSSSKNILIGSAGTPFQKSTLLMRTTLYNPLRSQQKEVGEDPIVTPNQAPRGPAKDIRKKSQNWRDGNVDDAETLIPETDLSPGCPCGFGVVDKSSAIDCQNCGRNQHRSCYGILNLNFMPQSFYCIHCFPFQASNHDKVSDWIYSCPIENIQILCILRRGLELCRFKSNLLFKDFVKHFQCEDESAFQIIERLMSDNFIKKGARGNEYLVQKKIIQDQGIPEYFPMLEVSEAKDCAIDKENIKDPNTFISPPITRRSKSRIYLSPSPNQASEELMFGTASNEGIATSTGKTSFSIKEGSQVTPLSKPKQSRKRSIAKQSLPSDCSRLIDSVEIFESSQGQKRARITRKK